MRALLFASLGAVLASCGGPADHHCVSSSDCPTAGQVCHDGLCTMGGPPDLGPSPDTGAPDGSTPDGGFDGGILGAGCSADLRDVLDFTGAVIATCPPDQGCSAGACIAACDAAVASRGSVGCTFLAMTPPTYPPALPPCHAVFVANTWPRPVQLTVTRGATTYDATHFGRIVDNARAPSAWDPIPAGGIPTDQVAVLFLSSDPASIMPETGTPLSCPITPAIDMSTEIAGSGIGDAWRIATDTPVSAYDIIPFGGAPSYFPSASLLLPTSALDTDYVVVSPPVGTAAGPGPMWLAVIGDAPTTHVTVSANVMLPGGGALAAASPGTPTTVMLSAGQVAQWQLDPASTMDTSGTLLTADHAVAVVTGNRFLRLQPVDEPGGEGAHQQILPVRALGNAYVAAPYTTRRADLMPETIPYRIVGAVDGTTLSYDPPIPGGPATIDRGVVVDFQTTLAFRVFSPDAMHPFALSQLMTTANVPGGSRPGADASRFGPQLGDEEFVITFPPSQFLSKYVFFTDPTYFTTNLALTRTRAAGGAFADVMVDCLGVVTGWQPAGTDGSTEVTTVDLVRGGVGIGTCTNGRHVASSTAPFGVVVWGTDAFASYAYPAGGNAKSISMVPPLM